MLVSQEGKIKTKILIIDGKMKHPILLILLMLLNLNCDDNPVKPENHSPEILSLVVFPEVIGVSDSAVVVCNAIDPDGDTLVYDWITDGRLKIKEGQGDGHFLYNTYENSRMVYSKSINNRPPIDTVWVQVFARDRKGLSNAEIIRFIVTRDLEKGGEIK